LKIPVPQTSLSAYLPMNTAHLRTRMSAVQIVETLSLIFIMPGEHKLMKTSFQKKNRLVA
jgi:hypothetical protein